MMLVAGPGERRLGDVPDRLARGVVLGHEADEDSRDGARQNGVERMQRVVGLDREVSDDDPGEDEEHAAARRLRIRSAAAGEPLDSSLMREIPTTDAPRPRDRKREREGYGIEPRRAENRGCSGRHRDGRDDGVDITLENIGAHARHVADVVTDVVGDGGRIARIVFGDPGLDLAHEVGAHVGGLGVDPAADAREQGDGRGAHRIARDDFAEPDQALVGDRRGVAQVEQELDQEPQADEAERGDRQPITAPPEKAMMRASLRPELRAASVVRTFARVAARMPR
jgi:hypothetical protein